MINYNDNLFDYILENSSPESEVLYDLNRHTHLNVVQPRMLSGHLQGKILEMISCMIRPEYILEIGTFTGYSAICLARGLKQNGKLITLEIDDELEHISLGYFNKAGLQNVIELIIGDALAIIPGINYKFDLVFIDGNKKDYIKYYNLIIEKVNSGGFILADNVLWDGKVTDPSEKDDPDTKAIIEFNKYVCNDKRVENVILPVRDGINIIKKK